MECYYARMELSSLVGWVGAGLIVLAYFLVSTKRVSPTGKKYQLINVFGAIGLGVNAFVQNAYPNFGLQVIWFFIGAFSLYKLAKRN